MAQKKRRSLSIETKRNLIEWDHPELSVSIQCGLLGLPRSSLYYRPSGEDPYNEWLMRRLDEVYTKCPFYGVERMTAALRQQGHGVNPKRVRRLLRRMGLEAIHPKPRLSQAGQAHRIYPYLLRDVSIVRPDQVWSADITYVRMRRGFVYLVAILDWFSRYVVAWSLSPSLESAFCVEALERALESAQPEIFNTDQGVQFTSNEFTGILEAAQIRISMDGRGRFLDNIFVERLWRTVKYEEVYLKDYENIEHVWESLAAYFCFYNKERFHKSLGQIPPAAVYFDRSP